MADEVTLPQSPAGSEPTLVELDVGRLGERPAEATGVAPPAEATGATPPAVSSPDESPQTDSSPAGLSPSQRRVRWRRIFTTVAWSVLVALVAAAVWAGVDLATGRHSDPSLRARAGDCLSGESDSDLKRVPCDAPDVRWTVVGVVEGKTRQEAGQNACAAWSNAEASYWESRNASTGFVLCLAPALTA
ncbi:LppU/SCO3897 family protein [Planosporangium sp. 12N6]|uniref:LppU/SCO3897 family protein n=1 Tax=Planosporangium spinosum TaxID=3402278 RepID=UPI003CE9D113